MEKKLKKYINKIWASSLLMAMVLSLGSCGKETTFSMSDFEPIENRIDRTYSLADVEQSELVRYNAEQLADFKNSLKEYHVEYGYDELFNYTKAMEGVTVDHRVISHTYSALDADGHLTKERLFEIASLNSAEYLENTSSVIGEVEEDIMLQICDIIVEVINDMLVQYPDIDKDRVYCNLGNLKIVEKKSALNYAAVEPGMVLHINRHTAGMANVLTSSNMYNVLVHETMHILQFGCECEEIDGCDRRFGLAHYYPDWDQDYADWTWLGEGSAERLASLYTQTEPMTYLNHVNYIRTFDLVTMLRDDVPANYIETLYFYDDADDLFSVFAASTEEEKQEIYKMIYSLEIMQAEPADIKEAYYDIYGIEWTDEVRDDVFNKVKRPIIQTVTKVFFNNLADAIMNQEVSQNDVMFLLNLYESTINEHLRLDNSGYNTYNAEFVPWYKGYRDAFFDSLENLSLEDYTSYVAGDGVNTVNATMKWIAKDKVELLIEKFEANSCKYMIK